MRSVLVIVCFVTFFMLTSAGRPSGATCGESQGIITRETYRSRIAETTMYYSVYTPPCYAEGEDYPALYLMHGSNEDDGQWVRLGLPDILDAGITAGTLPPIIVVMPFGEWIANENQFERVSWENVFLEELMPHVEAEYRIRRERAWRGIGGISRGGFWAFEIAFRHPELFSAVGGHSAYFDPGHAPPEYNPLKLAGSAAGLERLRIWLDRGKDDFAQPGLDLMDEALRARGLTYRYTVYPEGQHNNTYWKQHVETYLWFYAETWMQEALSPAAAPFAFATNTPQATAHPRERASYEVFLPAVAFPSLQTAIEEIRLRGIRAGELDAKLVLGEGVFARLQALGIAIHAGTAVLPDEAILNALWKDRTLYTLLPPAGLRPEYRILHVDEIHPLDGDLSGFPFAFQSGRPNYDPMKLTRFTFSGVTALTRLTREAIDTNGVTWAGEALLTATQQADFFHISNEVSFTADCPATHGDELGAFCSKATHFALFKMLGVDVVELSGNHNNDFGTDAYRETLDWYRQNGMRTAGGGATLDEARKPVLIEHQGNRIALVSCNWVGPYYALAGDSSPGSAPCDWDWLRDTLPQLAAENDLVVVTVQYQELEEYQPSEQQRLDFRGLADLGADVVLGTQAHKPQIFEFYNPTRSETAFIHYGLGNLFFDQPFWGNMRFFMDRLMIYEGRLLAVDLFTGIIDDNARPRPMTAEEQFNFLAFMFNTQGGL
jgi:poly-gamma-glutamate synthesis protein (capsule biosynthesis protein)